MQKLPPTLPPGEVRLQFVNTRPALAVCLLVTVLIHLADSAPAKQPPAQQRPKPISQPAGLPSSPQLPDSCGSRVIEDFGDFSLRVTGGGAVATFDFPWQVGDVIRTAESVSPWRGRW